MEIGNKTLRYRSVRKTYIIDCRFFFVSFICWIWSCHVRKLWRLDSFASRIRLIGLQYRRPIYLGTAHYRKSFFVLFISLHGAWSRSTYFRFLTLLRWALCAVVRLCSVADYSIVLWLWVQRSQEVVASPNAEPVRSVPVHETWIINIYMPSLIFTLSSIEKRSV